MPGPARPSARIMFCWTPSQTKLNAQWVFPSHPPPPTPPLHDDFYAYCLLANTGKDPGLLSMSGKAGWQLVIPLALVCNMTL